MIYSLIGELPRHLYVWIDSRFVLKEPTEERIPAVWFGLVSYPSRTWGCTVLLENGAVYRNLPPHALAFCPAPYEDWRAEDAQTWDCYGRQFAAIEYTYLSELACLVRANGTEHSGEYLFTVAPIGDGFSAYPEQTKEFAFVKLDNGRLTIQPTNHVVFREKSFTEDKLEFPKGLRRQTEVYHCE